MKKHSAFSLIELSVVILIIGILIAGVTQGSRLITNFRLQTAQTLTQNSPVISINNLILWYETSMENSFDVIEQEDNSPISTWYDINPQLSNKTNATQVTLANKPLFIKNVFNGGIPAVRFDGTSDVMSFNGAILANTSYTIFVVEQRRVTSMDQYFIGGSANTTNSNLVLGYRSNTVITQAHYFNDLDITITGLTTPTPVINTFWLSGTSGGGKKYWQNGGVTPDGIGSGSAHETKLLSFAGAAISGYGTNYNGNIGEIIMFNRALKTEERQSIETYLSKKYNIPIS